MYTFNRRCSPLSPNSVTVSTDIRAQIHKWCILSAHAFPPESIPGCFAGASRGVRPIKSESRRVGRGPNDCGIRLLSARVTHGPSFSRCSTPPFLRASTLNETQRFVSFLPAFVPSSNRLTKPSNRFIVLLLRPVSSTMI